MSHFVSSHKLESDLNISQEAAIAKQSPKKSFFSWVRNDINDIRKGFGC
ncbi:MAG: hypothetical protein F6K35_22425 [Okeania sp. SIO2H7]|nr:hypothetical protein [Okeania sp. SIO2H7]